MDIPKNIVEKYNTKFNVKLFYTLLMLLKSEKFMSVKIFHFLQGVPHQLDRVNGSKLRFWGQIRKFKKNESF